VQVNEALQIQEVLGGNHPAFAYFVKTYRDMAITIAYRVCNNKMDAEDIAQLAFVKAFHNLHTFRNKSKFSSWFYQIVYRQALNFIKNKTHDSDGVEVLVDVVEETGDKEMQQETINELLSKLPHEDALIVTLYYLEEMPVKEVALVLNWSESNVKIRLYRARKRMESYLNELTL
jgi:RNA polymerase sigma-70 factor (ECF subfamily)